MPENRSGRPHPESDHPEQNESRTYSLSELDALAHHIDGSFLVIVEVTGEKRRRRSFLTMASAERAARNAVARGHNARIYLAEARPLWLLKADEPGGDE